MQIQKISHFRKFILFHLSPTAADGQKEKIPPSDCGGKFPWVLEKRKSVLVCLVSALDPCFHFISAAELVFCLDREDSSNYLQIFI